jgi:hypothetical protein
VLGTVEEDYGRAIRDQLAAKVGYEEEEAELLMTARARQQWTGRLQRRRGLTARKTRRMRMRTTVTARSEPAGGSCSEAAAHCLA